MFSPMIDFGIMMLCILGGIGLIILCIAYAEKLTND